MFGAAMHGLTEAAEPSRDPLRAMDERLDDKIGGFVRTEGRRVFVELNRDDHLGADEGHVDVAKATPRSRSSLFAPAPPSGRRSTMGPHQPSHKTLADEARSAGDERTHDFPFPFLV